MVSFATIKTLGIFFAPILIPKAIAFYRSFRNSIKQRPPPRPLPDLPGRAITILFATCSVFLFLSIGLPSIWPHYNIFSLTSSRLTTSTELLFRRLDGMFSGRYSPELKAKLVTPIARKIYLRFGPDTLLSCSFCSLENPNTFLLYHLPFHVFLPHLVHLFIVGVITSAPVVGEQTSGWRNKFVLVAGGLALLDTYYSATIDPTASVKGTNRPPWSLYATATTTRFLAFTLADAIFASLIYVSATNRFFYVPPTAAEQAEAAASTAASTLSAVLGKLRTVGLTRHAVVRDRTLKARDDGYWRTIAEMEKSAMQRREGGEEGGVPARPPGSVWEEREVVDAIAKVMQGRGEGGGVDFAQVGVEAEEHVSGATAGLDVGVENPAA
ncbi:hypothetical protein FQN54_007287 [Arachnomyces sp. PD_36]|nr:hypothetical protein FQN54_007287 [Arachnomyces sp. PD_36]